MLASILILLAIGLVGVLISSPGGGFTWPSPLTSHELSIREIWTLSGIYIDYNLQPLILALDSKLIVLGSDDIHQQKSSVIAFDANTGHILWRVAYDGMVITSTGTNIIVGGVGKVMALDGASGKILWETGVQANVTTIVVEDNLLYVVGAASSHYYVLDAVNGDILSEIGGDYPASQEFILGNIVYKTTGEGDVVAKDRSNGEELWRNHANGISNLATTSSSVYILSRDGNLQKLNPMAGFAENFIRFIPSPFFIYSGEDRGFEYPYYIAVDTRSNFLFVYLGDSSQLFAFNLLK